VWCSKAAFIAHGGLKALAGKSGWNRHRNAAALKMKALTAIVLILAATCFCSENTIAT
jgi:hypothetical protein